MSESVILDPSDVATNRTAVDISDWITTDGADWGDSAIAAVMAEQTRGEVPIDYRTPNRQISIPLNLVTRGTVTFDDIRSQLQSKAAIFQAEGGWLARVTSNGGTVFADVVNATLHLGGDWMQAHRDVDTAARLDLECSPDFYGAEIEFDAVTSSTDEVTFTETGILGDYPGRVRVVVTDGDATDKLGLIWSFRSRYYDSTSTAANAYEAEALTPLDTSFKQAGTALVGGTAPTASGGTVVTHGTISTNWTPVVGTNIGGSSFLTHTGTYKVYARVFSSSGTAVRTRLVWDVGDLTNPAENDAWRFPGPSNYYFADLGEVRLDQAPVGTHRWQGQIQAVGDVGGESFAVDRVYLVNEDDGMGVLSVLPDAAPGLSTYVARDEFNQTAGTLTGKVLPIGGTWTHAGTASNDFSTSGTPNFNVTRAGTADADLRGWIANAGTATYQTVAAQVDFKHSVSNVAVSGLILRQANPSNMVVVYTYPGSSYVYAQKWVADAGPSAIGTNTIRAPGMNANQWYTLRAFVDLNGNLLVWLGAQGSNLAYIGAFHDSVLATGGTLATTGRIGIHDRNALGACTRSYDNFAAWVPPSDAAIFASQSAQLTTDGMFREDAGGTAYGPVTRVVGDLPRIPPAGLEGRTTEVFLRSSKGDLDQLPDN